MVNPLTTNPQRSEPVVDKEGLPTDQQIEFNDDIEIAINESVGGDSTTFQSYGEGELPLPSLNPNGIVFGRDPTIDFRLPVFSAILTQLTIVNITSVTEDGGSGEAVFNFTPGPTLAEGTEVNIQDFVSHPTYLGNFKVTFVNTGLFRISSILFAGSETVGKFTPIAAWRKFNDFSIVS